MPRLAREVFPGLPHHVVQRGNRRQTVFFCNEDRIFYLNSLKEYSKIYSVATLAYCLMTNHVHLLLVPAGADGLNRLMKVVDSQYALRINKRFGWKGHLWQARFFSSPIDNDFLRATVRYIERNPVRAGMVQSPEEHQWSSAMSHISGVPNPILESTNYWNSMLPEAKEWRYFLKEKDEKRDQLLRRNLSVNLPVGSEKFISELEIISGRSLHYRSQGRPKIIKGDRPL